MKKSTFLIFLVVTISVSCINAQTDKPNVVIFLADDLGYSDLSCYGSANVLTPVLDSLAAKGMKFTDFYAGSCVCSPSRAALMTGKNATRTGIYSWIPADEPMHLRLSEVTIPEILKEAGYQTAHFGKWHLGLFGSEGDSWISPSLTDHGFDYWFATDCNAMPTHKDPVNFIRNGVPVGKQKGFACQLVADETIDWLKSSYDATEPFYLNVWFNEPHEIVAAPEMYKKRHLENGIDEHMANYYGCIENMDHAVGRILRELDEMNALENTLVIFSSDNGSKQAGSNGILRGMKSEVWEGGIRVPTIVTWKNHVPVQSICTDPCGLIDLFPTIHSMINSEHKLDYKMDGINILPLLHGERLKRDKPLYVFYHRPAAASLRDGDWTLIGHLNERGPEINYFGELQMKFIQGAFPATFELYNLHDDIEQQHDVAGQNPHIVDRMKEEMIRLYSETIEDGGNWYEQEPQP
jgi:arylsulfatase A